MNNTGSPGSAAVGTGPRSSGSATAAVRRGAADATKPAWTESYSNCTIVVLKVTNLSERTCNSPEDELLLLHGIKQAYDQITGTYGKFIWRMHTFQYPYYGMCVPDVLGINHADLALQAAFELKKCLPQASQRSIPVPKEQSCCLEPPKATKLQHLFPCILNSCDILCVYAPGRWCSHHQVAPPPNHSCRFCIC